MDNYLEKPMFICGHRKTGTTMLLCLLDNHPELLVYPPDSGFYYMYYPKFESSDYTDQQKIDYISGVIVDQLKTEIAMLSEADRDDLNFPIKALRTDIISYAEQTAKTPRDMLLSLIQGYRDHFKGSPNPIHWVEKTTSTEFYAAEILKWFPRAKFIHVVRDPRDNWASLKSGWSARYSQFNDSLERLLQSMIDRGKLGLEFARHNNNRFGDDIYKVIKYEDLVTHPREVLNDICDFLEIVFSENMMVPTICGKLWRGNNFDGLKFDGPSNVNVGRWRERITEKEAKLIEYYFSDLMGHFGYAKVHSLSECMDAATEHYKWYNFAQLYSQTACNVGDEQ